MLQVKIKGGVV